MQLIAVTYDVPDPDRATTFWAAMLPGGDGQLGLRFAEGTKEGPDRLHLHLTSETPEDQERQVEQALDLGARHLDVGQTPEEGHVVLVDADGVVFCVIEPGNRFLAGCGPLGEVTCEGSREVGLFWHRALGWPLGWDQDGETSIQSPRGGTKVSWGGPPVPPQVGRTHQRLTVTGTDGLVELGARVTDTGLVDPDGNRIEVSPG